MFGKEGQPIISFRCISDFFWAFSQGVICQFLWWPNGLLGSWFLWCSRFGLIHFHCYLHVILTLKREFWHLKFFSCSRHFYLFLMKKATASRCPSLLPHCPVHLFFEQFSDNCLQIRGCFPVAKISQQNSVPRLHVFLYSYFKVKVLLFFWPQALEAPRAFSYAIFILSRSTYPQWEVINVWSKEGPQTRSSGSRTSLLNISRYGE